MRGHAAVIELRRQGLMPDIVDVNDFPCRFDPPSADEIRIAGTNPFVVVDGDDPRLADLRWAIGLTICLNTGDDRRAMAWADAFLLAKARMVVDYRTHTQELAAVWRN